MSVGVIYPVDEWMSIVGWMSAFNKSCLIRMNNIWDNSFESSGEGFVEHFKISIYQ